MSNKSSLPVQFIKQKNKDILFITKTSLVYGGISIIFSLIGLLLPEKQFFESPIVNGFNLHMFLAT